MLDEVLGWSWLVLTLASGALLALAWWTRPRGERRLCPGPASRLDPRRLFLRLGCWYDLTGLPAGDGAVRCPECGATVRRRLKPGRRLRLGVIGLTSALAAGACFSTPWIRGGTWARALPTLALVSTEHTTMSRSRRELQREVDRRLWEGDVTNLNARVLADRLIADLADDDIRMNGERAQRHLESLWPDSRPALERALVEGDAQTRLLAAQTLRTCCTNPSEALLAACVADLRDDSDEVRPYLAYYTAQAGANYLIRFPARIAPHIRPAMQSADRQQRFLAAAVAAHAGLDELLHIAIPILIEHLYDNDVSGDSTIARAALTACQAAALASLEPLLDDADEQAAFSARLIINAIKAGRSPDGWISTSGLGF